MAYDGDGNRVKKTVAATGITTYYLLDDRNPSGYVQVVEESTTVSSTTSLSKVYNYGLNLVSQTQPAAGTYYFILDGHGSTRALTDSGGNVANTFTYDAYGSLLASTTTPQTAYLYCCQQFDTDLGLYLNRARYLNQNTGRFWTMDTYEGSLEDPLSLHKYLYCAANPVGQSDPSGHDYSVFGLILAIYFGENGGAWDVHADGNVHTSGAGTSSSAFGSGDPNGFHVTYNYWGNSSGGQVIVYQTIESSSLFYGCSAQVDRGANSLGHAPAGVRLPPSMGHDPTDSGDTSYVDSPQVIGEQFYWKLTAVAVLRQNGRDSLLSTYYFEFDNITRVIRDGIQTIVTLLSRRCTDGAWTQAYLMEYNDII